MLQFSPLTILLRGGGDIATGIALRLYRSGFRRQIILETEHPLAVRRRVAFCEAVYEGLCVVEGITAALAANIYDIDSLWEADCIPVLIDPKGISIPRLRPDVIIEATLSKHNFGVTLEDASLVIGIGPGFTAMKDVHRVVETNRGPNLGRVLRSGRAEPDTGIPSQVAGFATERLLRAPQSGVFVTNYDIGDTVLQGDLIAVVRGKNATMEIRAGISGVLRGLLRTGTFVTEGLKAGDIDPRDNIVCHHVSEKSLAIGGGVLEAILERYNRPSAIRKGIMPYAAKRETTENSQHLFGLK